MVVCNEPAHPRISRMLADPGNLILRVRGSGHDGRLIHIRAAKCTIGSAAGCTLRLRAANVGPLHCWILRGAAGAVVRRLHGRTTLNGAALDEATLSSGDRLRLGSVELEVVECSTQQGDAAALPFPAAPPVAADTTELEDKLQTAVDRIHQLESESRQGFQSSIVAADRADQLRDALAAAHQQLEEACRELAATQEAMSRQSDELDSYRRKLNAAEAEEGEAAEQLKQARQTMEAAAGQRLAYQSELAGVQSRLSEESERFEAERKQREQFERRVRERETELSAAQDAIARQTAELQACRRQLEETEAAAAESRDATGQIAELESRLRAETERFEAERLQLERRLQQRDSELEAVRSTSTAQTGLMTLPMGGVEAAADPAVAEAEQRRLELERQLAERDSELETLRRLVGQHTIVEGRLEKLTRAYEDKCTELAAADARAVTSAEQSKRHEELESRARNLGQQEADLVERVAKVTEAKQQLTRERDALTVERQELLLDQATNRDKTLHLEQQAADLERHIAAANTRIEELDGLRDQLAGERAALDERAHRLGQRQRDLETKEADFEQRWSQLELRGHELDERAARLVAHEEAIESKLAAILEGQCEATPQLPEPGRFEPAPRENISTDDPSPAEGAASELNEVAASDLPPNVANVTAPWEPIERLMANAEPDPNTPMTALNTVEDKISLPAEPQTEADQVHDSNDVDRLVGRLVQAGLWRSGDGSAGQTEDPVATSSIENVRQSSVRQSSVRQSSVRQSSVRQSSVRQSSVRQSSVRQSSVRQSSVRQSSVRQSSVNLGIPQPAAVPPAEPVSPSANLPESPPAIVENYDDEEGRDDESIESYMDRLLKRVRNATSPAGPSSPPAATRVEPAPLPKPSPTPASPVAEEPTEYVPRTTAPELPANLSAMRELANTAARTAIDRHVRKHTGRQAAGRLVAAGLTISTSILLSYWAWRAHSLEAGVAAGIGGSIGIYWTLAALRRLFGAMRLSRPRSPQQ